MGSFWDHFGILLGSLWDHYGMIMGSLWDHFGIILESFWDHFGIIMGSFWDHFGIIMGSFWDDYGIILGSFWDHFGIGGGVRGHYGIIMGRKKEKSRGGGSGFMGSAVCGPPPGRRKTIPLGGVWGLGPSNPPDAEIQQHNPIK